ncbi:hypothetical protein CK203_059160 [Vitis vinifera]|uniref:Retrotransposon gag domain-containing protein n=1 Tax=Vitis vinifera TaxID=29760 RepID=A0A438GM05_VITVI|nr:hypothetical protein CK203_059160 [Vitis vinifera]
MDSQIVTVDQFAEAMASIQEDIASLGRRIDGQQAQQVPPQDGAYQTEVAPPPVTVPTPTSEDLHAPMDRLEQRFRMPEIERYMGIGCPHIHLRLYSTIMRAHGLDEAQMIMLFPMSLSGAAQLWFASLDDGISRGLWTDSSPSDIKGKKPFVEQRSTDVSAIGSSNQRPLRRHQPIPQLSEPHSSYAPHQYRSRAPRLVYDQTHMPQTLALPYYASQGIERPPISYMAIGQTHRQFSQLGMQLSQALRKLTEVGLLTVLAPRVLVHLGQLSVTTNPLPAHNTHVVPPPADDIHFFLDFDEIDNHIHMLSDDDSDLEPIMPDVIYEMSGVTLGLRMPAPFRLVPEAASVQAATVEPFILPYYSFLGAIHLDPEC